MLHHGVGGNFYGTRFYDELERLLLAQGYAVIRANNRGHDLMYNSPKGRLGAAYEDVDDCRRDWRAWIDFAEREGYGSVMLIGHSLGAVKTIHYLANEEDRRVQCAVAISPPRFCFEDYKAKPGGERFIEYYERAMAMVNSGNAGGLLEVDIPTNVVLSARTYVDKYGPADRYDIIRHLRNTRLPILVTIGSEEDIGLASPEFFAFGGLTQVLQGLSRELAQLSFELIQGADHMYTTRAVELWAAIYSWLQRTQPTEVIGRGVS